MARKMFFFMSHLAIAKPLSAVVKGSPATLRFVSALTLSSVVAACSSNLSATPTNLVRGSETAAAEGHLSEVNFDRVAGPDLNSRDRGLLHVLESTFAKNTTREMQSRLTRSNATLALALLDSEGHITHQISNRQDVHLEAKVIPATVRSKIQVGGWIAAATCPPPASAGTGPYQQLTDCTGYADSNSANVVLPCSGVFLPSTGSGGTRNLDDPYIYLGGLTPTAQVEIGEQWDPAKVGSSIASWQPYESIGTMKGITFPGNAEGDLLIKPVASSGSGDGQHWFCPSGSNSTVSLLQLFQVENVIDHAAYQWYVVFINLSEQPPANEIMYGVALPATPNNFQGAWNGWSGNISGSQCGQCWFQQTTSIAQPHDERGNGDFFGQIAYSYMTVADYTGHAGYTYCTNYPAWSSQSNECGTSPQYPLNDVIQTPTQDLTDGTGNETVNIDNAPGLWLH